jgi:hypothetical protein
MLKFGLFANQQRPGYETMTVPVAQVMPSSKVPINTAAPLGGAQRYRVHPNDRNDVGSVGGDQPGLAAQRDAEMRMREKLSRPNPFEPLSTNYRTPGTENPATGFFRHHLRQVRDMRGGEVLGVRQNNLALQ